MGHRIHVSSIVASNVQVSPYVSMYKSRVSKQVADP